MSQKTESRLVPPLTFRLYQSICFNRPIDTDKDDISPGGYELTMLDEDGKEKSVQFDFEDYEGNIGTDGCILNAMQKNPAYSEFEGINEITEHMLRNITKVKEWFIYTGEPGEHPNDVPLLPVAVKDVVFEIINDSTKKSMEPIQIPVTVPITPTCNF